MTIKKDDLTIFPVCDTAKDGASF
ncbi:unnamed protein product [Spirodela intermedia]|uniref:Uncharacterized protein n=2 Tax=Spirodela intermedia TaxID=51605 RepID=A0A7I8L7J7_SPIIN|nr:unnamed protein product [Spirodela intermedia]CAA6668397.1 unnamed protein product [Spirodela intermedia]CAA7405244.1 unnamed protein product [Spirodela intermedia]